MPELAKWFTAVPALIGFGLALGLNPALYGATLDTLARGRNIAARVGWMLAGLAVGATILFLVLHSFNPQGLVSAARHWLDAEVYNKVADVVAGIISLVLAAAVAFWKLRVPGLPEKPEKPPKANAHPISFFTIGLFCSVVGFTTLPIMYLVGRTVLAASYDLVLRVLAYCVFLVALWAPFLALAFTWSRFPRAGERVSAGYTKVLKWDYRWLLAGFLAVLGLACFALAWLGPGSRS